MKIVKIKIIITLAMAAVFLSAAQAGPFINITDIDAETDFPRVKLKVSAVNASYSGLSGLDENNIHVYENGFRVNYIRVKDITSDSDDLFLVFSIDSSKSISADFLSKIKKNARAILEAASPGDRIAVFRFNDRVKLLNNFTSNREEILKSIQSVERHGTKTLLYDSLYDALELLGKTDSGRRRGIIIFTDGKDEGSALKADDVIKIARENEVPLCFISMRKAPEAHILARMAKLTGGSLTYADKRDMAALYRVILSRIKSVYEIDYVSLAKRDGARNNLEVRLNYGDLKDRDTSEFSVERNFLKMEFPDYFNVLLALMVILLLTLLIVLLLLFLGKGKARFEKARNESTFEPLFNEYCRERNYTPLNEDDLFEEDEEKETPDVMYSEVWLLRKDGNSTGIKIPLIKSEATLGTNNENSIQINDEYMSGKHARIRRIEGGYYLYDLVSESGTFLNGKKLLRPRLLHDWDEIKTGKTKFIFRGVR
jgi:VWFA-related protein